ncbi:hypothetical protein KSZ_54400 [Dictyobacter formicarum]|uniref:Uncharacterized protein n=2 Tax=Dictyobacter formicarum TaxID=2778368 RepID=A0ABQ3VMJ1_9CHLR|nr:hypothetical protein KSZ_54400 [Dictyobacter formicarum]
MTLGITVLIDSVAITATEYDLQVQKGFWKRKVSWQQASLFAIGEDPYGTSQWVELSSATTILRWLHEGGPTKGEYLVIVCWQSPPP